MIDSKSLGCALFIMWTVVLGVSMFDFILLLTIIFVSMRVSVLSRRVDNNDDNLNDLTSIVSNMWNRMKDKDKDK